MCLFYSIGISVFFFSYAKAQSTFDFCLDPREKADIIVHSVVLTHGFFVFDEVDPYRSI